MVEHLPYPARADEAGSEGKRRFDSGLLRTISFLDVKKVMYILGRAQ